MTTVIDYLIGAANFIPHGVCLAWRPDLVAMHLGSDILIFLSYSSIPFAIYYFVKKRTDLQYKIVFLLFAIFILACGFTHMMGAITLWYPVYGLHGIVKVFTALISIATAILVWPILPKALALPSPGKLQTANDRLITEIEQRKSVEEDLRAVQRELEDRVKQRTIELERTNEQLNAILDNTVEGVVVIDEQGSIRHWSKSAAKMFGVERDKAIGSNVSEMMVGTDDDRDGAFLKKYIGSDEQRDIGRTGETVGRHIDGKEFPMEISVGEVHSSAGREYVGVVRDITQRKQTEAKLGKALHEAEAANQAKSQFLSNMSHELRTPLNAILGYAQLMQYGTKDKLSEWQLERVNSIANSGQILLELIQQILDLSRIESQQMSLKKNYLNGARMIEECVDVLRPLAQVRNIEVNIRMSDETPLLHVDELRAKQVLINLLNNAIKYNRDNGHVDVQVDAISNGRCRITIRDSGMGIDESRHAEVFEPFNRLGAEESSIEGTGIGLALSQRIVHAMGGDIGFVSKKDLGSSFWILLDAKVDEANEEPEVSVSPPIKQIESLSLSDEELTILYVEDNPANLQLIEDIFDQVPNLKLIATHSALTGLEIASSVKPNLIILDINLPGMDGFEALEALRENEVTKDIPVIALSADASKGTIERGLQAGFEEYLSKPLDLIKFFKVLKAITGKDIGGLGSEF